MQLGAVAAAVVHAAVVFVVVLITVDAVVVAAHSAVLALMSSVLKLVMLASRFVGSTPYSELFLKLMVLLVFSCESAQLMVPFRPRLLSASVSMPPPNGVK